jgi:hypothetical protein
MMISAMTFTATKIRFVREGKYFAEVAVDIIEDEMGWSPGLMPEGAEQAISKPPCAMQRFLRLS